MQIENSATWVIVCHHSASLVMLNSYPRNGIFNQYLTTIKDSYSLRVYKPPFQVGEFLTWKIQASLFQNKAFQLKRFLLS